MLYCWQVFDDIQQNRSGWNWQVLLAGIKNSEVISMIESGVRLELPAKMPGPLYQLIYKCWSYEPSERPTFKSLDSSIRQMMESYSEGGCSAGGAMLPPTKPPRPPNFPTSSSRDSFRSSGATTVCTVNDDVRQEDLARNLEEQRAQSRADGLWLRKQESESRHSYTPTTSSAAPMIKKRITLPLNIDRTNDEVYKALTALVQKIMDINQILEKVSYIPTSLFFTKPLIILQITSVTFR